MPQKGYMGDTSSTPFGPMDDDYEPVPFSRYNGEPLPKVAHVNVRLFGRKPNGDWRVEWRQVRVHSLDEAMRVAKAMPDVKQVYEVSWITGGCVT